MKFHAKKSLGQNFLSNPKIVERMIRAANLKGDEHVVEIGPGFGVLTELLARNARRVTSIEKDERLIEKLREKFRDAKNVEIIFGDALEWQPPNQPYDLIANIPYSITGPILNHYIGRDAAHKPRQAVLLVQKEVAEKMCAPAGELNVLALHVQTFGKASMLFTVSAQNFTPAPKVDSAVVHIDLTTSPVIFSNAEEKKHYFDLIHAAFAHKRKMLRATLPKELLAAAHIEETLRPENLTMEDWHKLASHNMSLRALAKQS